MHLHSIPQEVIHVKAVARYENVRALCHALRDGSKETVQTAADLLLAILPDKAVLLPAPGHNGYADVTLQIAKALRGKNDKEISILPPLKGIQRKSLYELKKAGKDISSIDLGLRAGGQLAKAIAAAKRKYPVFIIDTVVDTGTTATAVAKATGINDVLCIGLTDNFKH